MAGIVKRRISVNPYCEFCSTLIFEREQIFQRCDRYNARAHVKAGRAYTGVRIINYIVDNRKWVVEKQTRSFARIRFCPVCGYDYVEDKAYNGKKYVAPRSVNRLPEGRKE